MKTTGNTTNNNYKPQQATLDELISSWDANGYAIEDRGNGSANNPDVLLEYDDAAREAYGHIVLKLNHDLYISDWQNPNTNGEYDYRIIYPL